jgi:hypothetical protein
MFDYVAADGSEWEVTIAPSEQELWAVLEAHPREGGPPITHRVHGEVFGPHVIAEIIAHINERCAPCL